MRETAGVPTPPAKLDDDVLAFLRERHLSTLTTLRPDGSPHVVPVGFTWDEEALVARVITHRASRKVRHKSLTLDQAQAMLTAAEGTPMNAYIVLSLLTGVRTEELRALTWDHLDLEADPPTIMVWRSVRRGGETKTPRSRRTLELPDRCTAALRAHRREQAEAQLKAGNTWVQLGLVFCTQYGTALDAANVRRSFRRVVAAAGLDLQLWTPRELRHSFV